MTIVSLDQSPLDELAKAVAEKELRETPAIKEAAIKELRQLLAGEYSWIEFIKNLKCRSDHYSLHGKPWSFIRIEIIMSDENEESKMQHMIFRVDRNKCKHHKNNVIDNKFYLWYQHLSQF